MYSIQRCVDICHVCKHAYLYVLVHVQKHTHNLKRDKEIIVTITRLANQVGLLTISLTLEIKKEKNFF